MFNCFFQFVERLPSPGRREYGLRLLHGLNGSEEAAQVNGIVGKCSSPSVETSRDGVSTQWTSQRIDQANRDAQQWVVGR